MLTFAGLTLQKEEYYKANPAEQLSEPTKIFFSNNFRRKADTPSWFLLDSFSFRLKVERVLLSSRPPPALLLRSSQVNEQTQDIYNKVKPLMISPTFSR